MEYLRIIRHVATLVLRTNRQPPQIQLRSLYTLHLLVQELEGIKSKKVYRIAREQELSP